MRILTRITMPGATRLRGRPRSLGLLLIAGGAWCGLLAVGWARLYSHAYQYEPTRTAVGEWPCDTAIPRMSGRFQILVFIHPLCPCTRATLRELDESLARVPDEVAVVVIPVTAGLDPKDVHASGLVEYARQMPRVTLYFDRRGQESRRFGARVSGEVLGFDDRGRCVFHGGLTPGRGHEGDSAGQRELEGLACGRRHGVCEAPIFGCRLPVFVDDQSISNDHRPDVPEQRGF